MFRGCTHSSAYGEFIAANINTKKVLNNPFSTLRIEKHKSKIILKTVQEENNYFFMNKIEY